MTEDKTSAEKNQTINNDKEIYKILLSLLVWFALNIISTIVVYLMPNPFLYI